MKENNLRKWKTILFKYEFVFENKSDSETSDKFSQSKHVKTKLVRFTEWQQHVSKVNYHLNTKSSNILKFQVVLVEFFLSVPLIQCRKHRNKIDTNLVNSIS